MPAEAQLQSSFPIYIPKKKPSLAVAAVPAVSKVLCAGVGGEGDSAPTGYLCPVAPGASPAQAIPSTPK